MAPPCLSRYPRSMKWALVVIVFAAAVSSAGCFHHQAHLPGVIDMRTDGSGLPAPAKPKTSTDRKVTRPSSEALVEGAGLSLAGRELSIEDRHYWIFGSIPIYNESPTPELQAALDVGGAVTTIEVGEDMDAIGVLAAMFVPLVLPVTAWVLPPYTFHAKGRAAAWNVVAPGAAVAPREPELVAPGSYE
jgi:hypothetical protein